MGSVNIHVAAITDEYRKRLAAGLSDAGRIVQEEALRTITSPPKTGRKYPDLPNRSSRAGETPAYQFGWLFHNIDYTSDETKAVITSGAEYSAWLEYVADRAFMRPSLIVKFDEIIEAIHDSVDGGY